MPTSAKSFSKPDDTRSFPNGRGDIVQVDGVIVGRGELSPGWKWSNDVRPIAQTDTCEIPHTGYILAGELHVEMDDGSSVDLKAGDVYVIPAGHDAWVVGNQPCKTLEWSGTSPQYAVPPTS
jgi:ethanolamine utilization protein EutQ (cupin superfamily)